MWTRSGLCESQSSLKTCLQSFYCFHNLKSHTSNKGWLLSFWVKFLFLGDHETAFETCTIRFSPLSDAYLTFIEKYCLSSSGGDFVGNVTLTSGVKLALTSTNTVKQLKHSNSKRRYSFFWFAQRLSQIFQNTSQVVASLIKSLHRSEQKNFRAIFIKIKSVVYLINSLLTKPPSLTVPLAENDF